MATCYHLATAITPEVTRHAGVFIEGVHELVSDLPLIPC